MVDFMDAELTRHRKEQRPEQHDRRQAFQDAAEDDEGDNGDHHEHGGVARQRRDQLRDYSDLRMSALQI